MEPTEENFALTREQQDMFTDYLCLYFGATQAVAYDELHPAPIVERMVRDHDLLCELEELSTACDWFVGGDETYSQVKGAMLALIHTLFTPVSWNHSIPRMLRVPDCVYAVPRTGWETGYTRGEMRERRVCAYIRERKLRALLD